MGSVKADRSATGDDIARLRELEQAASDGARSFIAQGHALAAIKADKLYRLATGSWDRYCKITFGFRASHANHLINAAKVADVLAGAQSILTTTVAMIDNEAQARALAPLLDEPQALVDLWVLCCLGAADRGEKPTGRYISAVREQREPQRRDLVVHVMNICAEYLPRQFALIYKLQSLGILSDAGYASWGDFIADEAFDDLRLLLTGHLEGGPHEGV